MSLNSKSLSLAKTQRRKGLKTIKTDFQVLSLPLRLCVKKKEFGLHQPAKQDNILT